MFRLILMLVFGAAVADAQPPVADAIFSNARVLATDASQPQASAFAIAGGRFVAIGDSQSVEKFAGAQTARIDCGGKFVMPGLIDAHGHLLNLGSFGLGKLDFNQARTMDDVLAGVAKKVRSANSGDWILGGRWDHEGWPGRELPSHHKLSDISPDNPVWLSRVDGHAGLANRAAMTLAGIGRETKAPAGGVILRDASGEPTGIFIDNAMELITKHIGGSSGNTEELLLKAQEMCFGAGLVGVHDPGVSPTELEVYRKLAEEGRLKLRVYAMVAQEYALDYFASQKPLIGERLTIRACKVYMDGALGSRGALLLEPYADRPLADDGAAYRGLQLTPSAKVREICHAALRGGWQVCTHAIGDGGNRAVLDIYESAVEAVPQSERLDHRFRIEHAQVLAPGDIERFAKLGVIASMQPTHCTSDMRWVDDRLGAARSKGAYAWRSLRKAGARLAGGSDFPVESHNPFFGIYAAVTRQDADAQPVDGWHADERLTRAEAIALFTADAAYAAFEEVSRGAISPGLAADFIVIDRDLMTCPEAAIRETRVLRTVVAGETVYSASP